MLIAIKKIAPALATGNTIVCKPSEFAPVTVLEVRIWKYLIFFA
jgi:acyl-CoA reductase-like NAD-dependent aldehyde dehydrogenase